VGGLNDPITFNWSTTGPKTITVTAANIKGEVSDTHSLCIAYGNDGFIKEVRSLDTNDGGLPNPAGISYSFNTNRFYIITPASTNSTSTTIAVMTPYETVIGSLTINSSQVNPINIAFDDRAKRLLVMDTGANQLISIVAEATNGLLDPGAITRFEIGALGLQQPQGMIVDAEGGALFILDSEALEIVRVEPNDQGSFEATTAINEGRVSRLNIGAIGSTQIHGLALNPTNKHLLLLSPAEQKMYQLNQSGQIITTLDLSSFSLIDPQGLVFGFSGDPTDNPAKINLYIADTGFAPQNHFVYLPLIINNRATTIQARPSSIQSYLPVPLGRVMEFRLASAACD